MEMSTKRLFHYKREMSHDCRVFGGNRGFVREIPELPTIKRNYAFNRGYQKCPNSRPTASAVGQDPQEPSPGRGERLRMGEKLFPTWLWPLRGSSMLRSFP